MAKQIRTNTLLDFIRSYRLTHGYSPSFKEMCNGIGIGSTSMIQFYLKELENENKITRDP